MDDRRIAVTVWTHASACSPVHQLTNHKAKRRPGCTLMNTLFQSSREHSPIQWNVFEIYSRTQMFLVSI